MGIGNGMEMFIDGGDRDVIWDIRSKFASFLDLVRKNKRKMKKKKLENLTFQDY